MSDKAKAAACRCLCGAVRFVANLKNHEVGVCHCGMCRRWSGGAFMCVEFEGALDVDPDSHALVGVFRSSDWGERGFCRSCGSSLFWRMQDGTHGVVSAHAIEDLGAAKLTSEIFYDEKPDYYSFSQDTHKLTGAEVMALFAPKPE